MMSEGGTTVATMLVELLCILLGGFWWLRWDTIVIFEQLNCFWKCRLREGSSTVYNVLNIVLKKKSPKCQLNAKEAQKKL